MPHVASFWHNVHLLTYTHTDTVLLAIGDTSSAFRLKAGIVETKVQKERVKANERVNIFLTSRRRSWI